MGNKQGLYLDIDQCFKNINRFSDHRNLIYLTNPIIASEIGLNIYFQ